MGAPLTLLEVVLQAEMSLRDPPLLCSSTPLQRVSREEASRFSQVSPPALLDGGQPFHLPFQLCGSHFSSSLSQTLAASPLLLDTGDTEGGLPTQGHTATWGMVQTLRFPPPPARWQFSKWKYRYFHVFPE